jgi:acetyl esterase/lipase
MDAATTLDPEVAEGLAAVGIKAGMEWPPPGRELLETMRSQTMPFDPTPPAGVVREDIAIPGVGGGPDVAVRVHRPTIQPAEPVPALLWLHGGSYILGSYDLDVDVLDRAVLATGCVGMGVNYRLSPETPYPGPLDDCHAALSFLASGELGVDGSHLVVGGRSAGAGLATALTLRARDAGIAIVHQHLIYPMIDDTNNEPRERWDDPVWPAALNQYAWRCYLGSLFGTSDVPALAAPARADDLTGLPSVYLHVGTHDAFLREGLAYAHRLIASEVPMELHIWPGVPHAFDVILPHARVSQAATSLSDAALNRALVSPPER